MTTWGEWLIWVVGLKRGRTGKRALHELQRSYRNVPTKRTAFPRPRRNCVECGEPSRLAVPCAEFLHGNALVEFDKPPFSAASFSWALLRANSCARHLRVFCFPGSALKSCDLNHRLAISEASVGRSSACKSCKSDLCQSTPSDVWSIGWPEEQSR